MGIYVVRHRYGSWRDGVRLGPWEEGDRVDLDDEVAAHVERDSPGTLTAVDVDSGERQKTPSRDRQHKGGRTR